MFVNPKILGFHYGTRNSFQGLVSWGESLRGYKPVKVCSFATFLLLGVGPVTRNDQIHSFLTYLEQSIWSTLWLRRSIWCQ